MSNSPASNHRYIDLMKLQKAGMCLTVIAVSGMLSACDAAAMQPETPPTPKTPSLAEIANQRTERILEDQAKQASKTAYPRVLAQKSGSAKATMDFVAALPEPTKLLLTFTCAGTGSLTISPTGDPKQFLGEFCDSSTSPGLASSSGSYATAIGPSMGSLSITLSGKATYYVTVSAPAK